MKEVLNKANPVLEIETDYSEGDVGQLKTRVKRTYSYAATTKDAAERRRWTFYEAIKQERRKI